MSSRLCWSKKSVGRTYATDSEEEAEWDGCFGLFLGGTKFRGEIDVCLWALYGDLFGCGC